MTHQRVSIHSAGDFESPTSASSVIRAEGTHSRTSPQSNVDAGETCHNPRHTFGTVERDSGDNILPFVARPRLGGFATIHPAIVRGWRFAHLDAPVTPEAA